MKGWLHNEIRKCQIISVTFTLLRNFYRLQVPVVVSILPSSPPLPPSCIGVQKMKILFPPPTPTMEKKLGLFECMLGHLIG